MQARVMKWKAMSESRVVSLEQFEAVREASNQQESAKRKQEWIEHQLQKILPLYRDKIFSDFETKIDDQARIKKIAERYVETFSERLQEGSGLIFSGCPGTGKTLLSMIIYQALVEVGHSVSYERTLQFLRSLKDANFTSHSAYQSLLDHQKRIPLLIIDEVTKGYGGKGGCLADWEQQMLFDLIDLRYQLKLCTLVISNHTQSDIISRLGNSTIDRLFEKNVFLSFNWGSYRSDAI